MFERITRLVLKLYPGQFRRRFGQEMLEFIRSEQDAEKRRPGGHAPIRFWVRTLTDVLKVALRLRLGNGGAQGPAPLNGGPGSPQDPSSLHSFTARQSWWKGSTRDLSCTFWWQGISGMTRTATRHPRFTAGVVLTLALGIGANATMYGIVDRLLLQPPAHVQKADQVRRILLMGVGQNHGIPVAPLGTYPDYDDLKHHRGMSVAAYTLPWEETIGSGRDATRAVTSGASFEFFPLLGVQPLYGRFFSPAEGSPSTPLTAVLSQEYWERRYGSDPAVLGATMEIAGRIHTIIGIAPDGFTGVEFKAVDVWVPLEPTHVATHGEAASLLQRRGPTWMRAVARVGESVDIQAVEAEATRLHLNGRREMIAAGHWPPEVKVHLVGLSAALRPGAPGEIHVVKWLTGVSIIVLLIACANVANLLLAQGIRRRREIAVRVSLGAPRGRLVGESVLESLLLSLLGGGVGLILAALGGDLMRSVLLPGLYFPGPVVNGRVLGYSLVVSVAAGLVASIIPALQGSRTEQVSGLREASRGNSATRSTLSDLLTVAQAAMSMVLLVGAGLFVRSLGEVRNLDLGIDTQRVHLARMEFNSADLDTEAQRALYREAEVSVSALPSVESATSAALPFQWQFSKDVSVPHLDSIPRLPGGGPYYFPVSPGYFRTVGLRITRGRRFHESDDQVGQKVAVVNQTMARTLWPDTEPLGSCFYVDPGEPMGGPAPSGGREECTTVIGIAENAAIHGYEDGSSMVFYLPLVQTDHPARVLYIRPLGLPGSATADAAHLVRSISPEVRFATIQSLEEVLSPQARSWVLGATMFSVFGFLALALAAIGLYGVLAFEVVRRTRELGVRTALGADRTRLMSSILFRGGRLVGIGIVIGIGAVHLAAPFAAGLFFNISPRDLSVSVAASLMLSAVALASSLVPALRATRVDPVVSLRAD